MKLRLLLLLAIVILLLAVVFAPVSGQTRWIYALHDAAHGPIFGCVAVLLMAAMHGYERMPNIGVALEYLAAFVVAVLLGALTEVLQLFVGRDASFMDFRNDTLGILAFLALYAVIDRRVHRQHAWRWRVALLVIAAPLVTVIASPLTDAAAAYNRRAAVFPALADFSRGLDRYFLRVHFATLERKRLPERWARNDAEHALLVRFGSGDYPGIALIEPEPDWREYSVLAVDVVNPTDADLALVLRVHDKQHNNLLDDRFNTRLLVHAKQREVFRIPLQQIRVAPRGRELDLQHVAGVILFATRDSKARQMYVGGVWLEGDGVAK